MKRLTALLTAGLLLFSLTGCNQTEPKKEDTPIQAEVPDEKETEAQDSENKAPDESGGEINILTWQDYVPKEVIDKFTAETGIKVNYASANDNESMLSKLQAAKGGEYDVIICSDYIIKVMLEDGSLLKEFDKEKLPNFSNIDPVYQNQYYDPENKYSIPYTSSSAILVYDSSAIDFEINSYADLWRPELKDSIVLLDGGRDIIGLTLQSLGYSLNTTDENELAEAKAKLLELKPNVIGFDANQPHSKIISGEAVAGYMFGSQVTAAMAANEAVRFAYPEEGLGMYTDCVVMAQNAPNEENAYKFINFILEGENSAAISNIINYTNCNTAAREFLSEEFLNNETINIPADVMEKSESYMDLGEATALYDDIWVAFKNQ